MFVLIIDVYRYSPHSSKYLTNEFTSVFARFLNNLIFKRRFDFRSGFPTNHTISNLVENIIKYIDDGNYVCGVFSDLEKAFETKF